jgi:hypothetical protein
MLADAIADRIALAGHPAEIDEAVKEVWGRHLAGDLTEGEAETLQEAAQARRTETWPKLPAAAKAAPRVPARRPQRSPDKQASIERRRRLAKASPVPAEHVDRFTQGEHAVVTVIAGEIARAGACDKPLAWIAALAGTCKTVVRAAVKKGWECGLWHSKERRRRGQNSLTNLVRAISRSWAAFLRRWAGSRKSDSTELRCSDASTQKPGMVSGYRRKRLGGGSLGHRPTEKGGTAARGGSI